MPYPTPIVEIAFDDGPYVVNPTWTDVSSWVRRMNIDRGRSDDWGDFNSIANVVLNNRTRRFDPYFTSGPYYGKLLPRKQIRIRATAAGTTYDVFRGFIDGFNPTWTDAGTDSVTTIQCFDALQLLAGENIPADWADNYIRSTNPRHYYPMDEPIVPFAATTVLKDYGSIPLDIKTTTATSTAPSLASGLPSSAATAAITTTSNGVGENLTNVIYPDTNFSVACWLLEVKPGNSISGSCGRAAFNVFTSAGLIQVIIYDGVANQVRQYDTAQIYEPGIARHIGFSFNLTTKAFVLYVNGVVTSTTLTVSGSVSIFGEYVSIGVTEAQQLVIWSSVQPQSTFQTIYERSYAIIAETTSARFNRIIATTPFPASLTSAPASPVNSVLDITYGGTTASDELRIVQNSEGGPLFVSKSGVITLFAQNQIFTAATSLQSQVTYGDGGVKMGTEATLTTDGDSMRNQAQITMSQGGVFSKTNTGSVTTYGTSKASVNTQVQTTQNASNLADLITGFGGVIYPQLTPIPVVLSPDDSWNSTLALELMQRVTVKLKPPTGNLINYPMLVQRITHDVVPGKWTTTLEGSTRWASVFIVGQSLIGGTDLLG